MVIFLWMYHLCMLSLYLKYLPVKINDSLPPLTQEGFAKGSKKNHLAFTQLYCLFLLAFLSAAWSLSWARSPCSFTHQMVGPLPENKQKGLNWSAEWPQEALQPLDEVPPVCVCLMRRLALLFGSILNKPALRENDSPSGWHQVTWGLFIFPRTKHFTPCPARTHDKVQISSPVYRFSSRPIFPCSCSSHVWHQSRM